MPEGVIQLAPDSTGKKARTRTRVVGANTIHEQYLLPGKDAVVANRSWACSPRVINRVGALDTTTWLSQVLFTIWNGHATNLLSVRRIGVEIDTTVARTAPVGPWLRMYRIAAAPTGGTAITPIQQDTGDAALSGVSVASDAATDTTNSATALAVTGLAAAATPSPGAWEQIVPKAQTLAGYMPPIIAYLVPDDSRLNGEDPITLRPSQGLAVRLEAPPAVVATAGVTNGQYAAGTWSFHFKAVLGQFVFA